MNKRESKKQKEQRLKKGRIKAILFVLPCISIIFLTYFWAMWHINHDGELLGMTWELRMIFTVITFVVMKQYIFKGILKHIVKITKALQQGKTITQMIDDKIPLEEEGINTTKE